MLCVVFVEAKSFRFVQVCDVMCVERQQEASLLPFCCFSRALNEFSPS